MSYDGLPASITVDGVPYTVALDETLPEDGEYTARACTIRLRPDMALPYARAVLIHEWLHALWEHSGLTADGKETPNEEMAVTALAYRVLESLRANPQLLAFLTMP